jgi:hypothetical protein
MNVYMYMYHTDIYGQYVYICTLAQANRAKAEFWQSKQRSSHPFPPAIHLAALWWVLYSDKSPLSLWHIRSIGGTELSWLNCSMQLHSAPEQDLSITKHECTKPKSSQNIACILRNVTKHISAQNVFVSLRLRYHSSALQNVKWQNDFLMKKRTSYSTHGPHFPAEPVDHWAVHTTMMCPLTFIPIHYVSYNTSS